LRLNFAKQGEDDGGPSWSCQNKQNQGPDSEDQGLVVVNKHTNGKVQLGPKLNPILSFQFASLLVSRLLIFLHGFEVLEDS